VINIKVELGNNLLELGDIHKDFNNGGYDMESLMLIIIDEKEGNRAIIIIIIIEIIIILMSESMKYQGALSQQHLFKTH